MTVNDFQNTYAANGNGVIIPISLRSEIKSEKETSFVLMSETMKIRLRDAMKRDNGFSFRDVTEKLGIRF